MITDLNDEALEYGHLAIRALEGAGGDRLAPLAEEKPSTRASLVESTFAELGAWDLDPLASIDEAEAAAALCRSSGWWAIAYPVAERLARPADLGVEGLIVVDRVRPAAAVGSLGLRWAAVDLVGRRTLARPRSEVVDPRKDGYVVPLELEAVDDAGLESLSLGLVLSCWTLLGMLDRAVDLTRGYVVERKQFDQPLAGFQSVQFQLTEAEVERVGLQEQAKYALWSIETRSPDALGDALALRVAAIQAAEIVFRVAHQLHGAIGFCDETMISWLSRASVPLRRLPLGLSASRAHLLACLGPRGLAGLFTHDT